MGEGLLEQVRWKRSVGEGPLEKVRRRRSVGEDPMEKARRRRPAGEGPREKIVNISTDLTFPTTATDLTKTINYKERSISFYELRISPL